MMLQWRRMDMLDLQTIGQTLAFCFVMTGLAAPISAPVLINLLARLESHWNSGRGRMVAGCAGVSGRPTSNLTRGVEAMPDVG
jgi:hypothetical protein